VVPDGARQALLRQRLELEDVDRRGGQRRRRALCEGGAWQQNARGGAQGSDDERDRLATPHARVLGAGRERLTPAVRAAPAAYARLGGFTPRKRKQLFQAMSAWTSGGRPRERRVLSTGISGAMYG